MQYASTHKNHPVQDAAGSFKGVTLHSTVRPTFSLCLCITSSSQVHAVTHCAPLLMCKVAAQSVLARLHAGPHDVDLNVHLILDAVSLVDLDAVDLGRLVPQVKPGVQQTSPC